MFAHAARLLILRLLNENDQYYFSSALAQGSGGVLTQGQVATQLTHMESSGLVESVQESDAEYYSRVPLLLGAIRRRKYKITFKGRQELDEPTTSVPSPTLESA